MVAITSGATDKMKALVQDGDGSADVLHLRQIDKPAVTDDRVLVKVHAASVNAADYHMVHGMPIVSVIAKLLRQRPQPVRGLDIAGVVEAVGTHVMHLRPGDEVFGVGPGRGRSTRPAPSAASCRSRRGCRSSRPLPLASRQ